MKYLVTAGLIAAAPFMAAPSFAQGAPVDPTAMVDAFEGVFGVQNGFRRSGARGVCASGTFVGTKEAKGLSSASAFSGKPVPVTVRFSIGGGNPKAPENASTVRGMSLQFNLPKNEQWLMANINTPVFTAATPESMLAFLQARKPDPATGKPNPDLIKATFEKYPDQKAQPAYLASVDAAASFGAQNYWGVNGFHLVNAKGKKQPIKWVFEPVSGVEGIPKDKLATTPTMFLNDELRARVAKAPVEFRFMAQLADANDVINSAVTPLPAERKKVNLGTLKVTKVEAEGSATCNDINFDPNVLPKGVEPSNDPILEARSGAYAVSQGRRLSGN